MSACLLHPSLNSNWVASRATYLLWSPVTLTDFFHISAYDLVWLQKRDARLYGSLDHQANLTQMVRHLIQRLIDRMGQRLTSSADVVDLELRTTKSHLKMQSLKAGFVNTWKVQVVLVLWWWIQVFPKYVQMIGRCKSAWRTKNVCAGATWNRSI